MEALKLCPQFPKVLSTQVSTGDVAVSYLSENYGTTLSRPSQLPQCFLNSLQLQPVTLKESLNFI